MTGRIRRTTTAAALVLAGALGAGSLTGCGLALDDVPLPGLVAGPTYLVTVEFDDALNLPVDAPVKLAGATVGQVHSVEAGEYVAEVELAIVTSVELRESSRAEIRLTSPMGTAFVELFPGPDGPDGPNSPVLADGDTLPVTSTGSAPDVTDLLSALSTVVTGGSFADISTIIDQLNVALTGNTDGARLLLRRLDRAVTDLNGDFPRVDRLTASLDRLTTRLAGDLPTITRSLTELTDLVTSLDRQRADLVAAMESLRQFDVVATPLTAAVRSDLVALLDDMRPVVRTLLRHRSDVDAVMAGLVAFASGSDSAAPGDFANFDLTFLLDPDALAATGKP